MNLYSDTFGDSNNPACLLICGAMSHHAIWTAGFCRQLTDAGYFVIRYDHRDSGHSPASKTSYGLHELALDALAILDHYHVERAHTVGHSMGGHICQQLALEAPQRLLSITTISSALIGAIDQPPLSENEQTTLKKTWEVMLGRQEEDGVAGYVEVFRYLSGSAPFDPQLATAYARSLLKNTNHPPRAGNAHERLMRELGETLEERRGLIETISTPTLVIHGSEDPLVLPREARALAAAIPTATLQILPKMGHFWFHCNLEQTLAQLVVAHLKAAR